MANPSKMSPFTTLHHICIVVRDIDKAVAFYESVGVGPWHDYPPLDQYTELEVPSREAFLGMTYKYADIVNAQIQLCQPGDADGPQKRYLDTHGEGVFHVGFAVDRCDDGEELGKRLGLDVIMRGRRPDRSGFTYFDTAEQAGVVLEVRSSPPRR